MKPLEFAAGKIFVAVKETDGARFPLEVTIYEHAAALPSYSGVGRSCSGKVRAIARLEPNGRLNVQAIGRDEIAIPINQLNKWTEHKRAAILRQFRAKLDAIQRIV